MFGLIIVLPPNSSFSSGDKFLVHQFYYLATVGVKNTLSAPPYNANIEPNQKKFEYFFVKQLDNIFSLVRQRIDLD